jgi:hypothetical protein
VKTAKVAASYAGDIANSARVQTLLASSGGAASGGGTGGTVPAASNTKPAAQAKTITAEPQPTTPSNVTVTFDANGGSGSVPPAQTVEKGTGITVPGVGALTKSGKIFKGWNTRANGSGLSYTVGDTLKEFTDTRLYAQWEDKVYKVGDKGPGGGWIFYDKGRVLNGWRYLEAAPKDEPTAEWGASGKTVDGTATGVGAGKRNTELILEFLKNSTREVGRAAQFCEEQFAGNFDDWFLPSKDELNLMYQNLKVKGLGGFGSGSYWSSSQRDNNYAWYQGFSDGGQNNNSKYLSFCVRAVRAF